MITGDKLREKYLQFFQKKGHKKIEASPLVLESDPTTLFTSSGMQPLVPFLLGKEHPLGKRLTNIQPSFRAQDIDQVGDNRHTTFFEMLGNWSLGDYFKKEQLSWCFEFLTGEVGLDPKRLFVSVFGGDKRIPRDEESIKIWQELFKTKKAAQEGEKGFLPEVKIYTYGVKKNWWSKAGEPDLMPVKEPGGPDSEVFYDFGQKWQLHEKSPFAKKPCHINCDCGRFLEIGNSVFMEYQKKEDSFEKLPQRNVDFGGGLERILAASCDEPDIFKIDLFWPIIKSIEEICGKEYQGNEVGMRVIADHLKAATFMISQGLQPGNKLQAYILRRLLRRAAVKVRFIKNGFLPVDVFSPVCKEIIEIYQKNYFPQAVKIEKIVDKVVSQEVGKFGKSLDQGLKLIQKSDLEKIEAKFAFDLFQTYGFPFEVTQELLLAKGRKISQEEFDKEFERHQERSRTFGAGMFKGGLAYQSDEIVKLHTVTHLLHQALREVLGKGVKQAGSNITAERLRFDFSYDKKLTEEEIEKVEEIVNEQIKKKLPVKTEEMSLDRAREMGALAFFDQKYGQTVKVYSIGDFSREVCGGPHVTSTEQINGYVRIIKEEAVGTGKRRIYAVIEDYI